MLVLILGTIAVSLPFVLMWAAEKIKEPKQLERDQYFKVAHRIGNIGKFVGTGLHGHKPILGLLPPKGEDGHLRDF